MSGNGFFVGGFPSFFCLHRYGLNLHLYGMSLLKLLFFIRKQDDFTAYFLSERSWIFFRAGVKRSDLTLTAPLPTGHRSDVGPNDLLGASFRAGARRSDDSRALVASDLNAGRHKS